jgi:hypothetical protein
MASNGWTDAREKDSSKAKLCDNLLAVVMMVLGE